MKEAGEVPEHPIREYVAALSGELAQMARGDGDDLLAALLELAQARAQSPAPARTDSLPA